MSHHPQRLQSAARPITALLVACLLSVLAAAPAAHAGSDTFTSGSGTWTAPDGVTSITVECWGGGGGGGGDSVANNNTNGGGGGGGAYAQVTSYAVVPGNSYAYTVGAGGSGGTGGGAGGAGGDSSFHGGSCLADGGAGGGAASSGGNGGAGGTTAGSTGNVIFTGGSGSDDVGGGNAGGGGGGGSAGTASNGNPATNTRTGATAVTGGGPGGNGSANGDGSAPVAGPGGGGGGGKYDTANRNGGNGFAGKIVITYKVTPLLSVTNSPVTYNGLPQSASLTAAVGLTTVPGSFSNIRYNNSPTAPTNAGAYVITADFTPADTATYHTLTNAPAGSFIIDKAGTATTVTCTAGPFPYTGAPITPCAATVTGVGELSEAVTVNYSNNVSAGTATASATYAESTNHLTSSDSTTFLIDKATPALAITNSPATYNGAQQAVVLGAGTPPGTVPGAFSNILYDGTANAPRMPAAM